MEFQTILELINQFLPTIASVVAVICSVILLFKKVSDAIGSLRNKDSEYEKTLDEVKSELNDVSRKYNEVLTEITKIYHGD